MQNPDLMYDDDYYDEEFDPDEINGGYQQQMIGMRGGAPGGMV